MQRALGRFNRPRVCAPWGPRRGWARPCAQPAVDAPLNTSSGVDRASPCHNPDGGVVPPVASAHAAAHLPFYSQYPLDRRDEWRRDEQRLNDLFSRSDAKLLPLLRDRVLVRPASAPAPRSAAPPPTAVASNGGPAAAAAGGASPAAPAPAHPPPATTATSAASSLLHPVLLCPAAAHADLAAASPARVFLGTDADGAPYFAAAVASAAAAEQLAAASPGASWVGARTAGPDMAPGDASLCAVASGLLVWHGGNGFSASTGAPTLPAAGGFSRKCSAGGGSAYPRIDPAVIMLVSAGDFALLGRKAEWPTDRYSTLAGFLEVGEPLEAAVVREVAEEAGVQVDLRSVTYAASQPWPFPRSLMVGFHAAAAPAPHHSAPPPSSSSASPSPSTSASSPSASASAASTTNPHSNGADAASGDGAARGAAPPPSGPRQWWQPAPAPADGFDLLPLQGRRAALDVGVFAEEVAGVLGPLQGLQWPAADAEELADVRWFHRDWLRAVFRSPAGAALVPGAGRFNIPGPYSLAYRLITSWAGASPAAAAAQPPHPPPPSAGTDPWVGDSVPQVLISGSGSFKYVLMRLWDPAPDGDGRSRLLVWGDTRAPYHNDVLQKAKAMARPLGLQVTPLGGGRMRHDPASRQLDIFGYSAAFGPAPHELVAALVHRWYPLYDRQSITVSYEGY